jgi:hypothetical protein
MQNKRLIVWLLGAFCLWLIFGVAAFVTSACVVNTNWIEAVFTAAGALFSGLAFAGIYCTVTAQQEQINQQKVQFEKQVELGALTAYAEITKALWQHNTQESKHADPGNEPGQAQWWQNAAGVRYNEMIKAKEAFEKTLRERGVLEN